MNVFIHKRQEVTRESGPLYFSLKAIEMENVEPIAAGQTSQRDRGDCVAYQRKYGGKPSVESAIEERPTISRCPFIPLWCKR